MKKLTLKSFAKLNLFLEVLNIRQDNYHNIKTLFERIDLCDKIILKSRRDKKIKIICKSADVPADSSNLAYKSAKLLQDSFRIDKGVEITIIKRIPVGSGLGGGSSNAASVILGLNKLWRLNLKQNELAKLARNIGADVCFFIYNCPFAWGQERGDKIRLLKALKGLRLWHILVVPKIKVSTRFIYKKWDRLRQTLTPPFLEVKRNVVGRAGLTPPKYDVKILTLAIKKHNLTLLGETLFNSLEQVTTKLYAEVEYIKQKLINLGLKSILMSGSGPAVFGIVTSRKEAVSLCRQLKENRLVQVFVTRTI